MSVQSFLLNKFKFWIPKVPEVVNKTKRTVTLDWSQDGEIFEFFKEDFLYKIEKKMKLPTWVIVYSGGKTTKTIDNLAPGHPHRFRLQITLRPSSIDLLSERAIAHFGNEQNIYWSFRQYESVTKRFKGKAIRDETILRSIFLTNDGSGDGIKWKKSKDREPGGQWHNPDYQINLIRSDYSDHVFTNTESEGASSECFCMAVRCGYIKQLQHMLEERPILIEMINTSNGFTPLITAVKKGDPNIVRWLIVAGADVNQPLYGGQTPLDLALFDANLPIANVLIEFGADITLRDCNDLRAEHYAVSSNNVEVVKFILDHGGDVTVTDSNKWTPLFRAVCEGADLAIVQELIKRGSRVDIVDGAGLTLPIVAKMFKDKRGPEQDTIIRLVDPKYPHEKALGNFTRLTKKISRVHTYFKFNTAPNKLRAKSSQNLVQVVALLCRKNLIFKQDSKMQSLISAQEGVNSSSSENNDSDSEDESQDHGDDGKNEDQTEDDSGKKSDLDIPVDDNDEKNEQNSAITSDLDKDVKVKDNKNRKNNELTEKNTLVLNKDDDDDINKQIKNEKTNDNIDISDVKQSKEAQCEEVKDEKVIDKNNEKNGNDIIELIESSMDILNLEISDGNE